MASSPALASESTCSPPDDETVSTHECADTQDTDETEDTKFVQTEDTKFVQTQAPDDAQTEDSETPAVWSCERCHKQLTSAWKYARHLRVHSGEKPFECTDCLKKFSQKSDCDRHEKLHSAKYRGYDCSVCGKTLRSSSSLTKHMTIHTGEKKFICNVCNKRFPVQGDLTKHARIHTGEKPYQCGVCQRSFAESSTRNKHMLTHRSKSHQCPVCYEYFTRRSDLKRHIDRKSRDVDHGRISVDSQLEESSATIDVPVYDINDIKSGKVRLGEGEVLLEAILNETGEMTYVAVTQEQADAMIINSEVMDVVHVEEQATDQEAVFVEADKEIDEAVRVVVMDCEPVDQDSGEQTTVGVYDGIEEDAESLQSTVDGSNVETEYVQIECVSGQTDSVEQSQATTEIEGGTDPSPVRIATRTKRVPARKSKRASNAMKEKNDAGRTYVFSTGKGEVQAQFVNCSQPGSAVQSVSESQEFMCSKCDQILSSAELLQEHITTEHLNNQPSPKALLRESVNSCAKIQVDSSTGLESNVPMVAMQHKARVYPCSYCSLEFPNLSKLTSHLRSHSQARPYGCRFCDKTYKCEGDLNRHVVRIHTGQAKRHKCSTCGATLSSVSALKKHQFIHSGQRNFQCDRCPKSFYAKGDLEKHYRTHTGDKPYKCSYCGRRFAESSTRNAHERLHRDEKPYACTVCSKRFARSGDLRRHTRQHTGERRHKCQQCETTFPDSSGLMAHKVQVLDPDTGKLSCCKVQEAFVIHSDGDVSDVKIIGSKWLATSGPGQSVYQVKELPSVGGGGSYRFGFGGTISVVE